MRRLNGIEAGRGIAALLVILMHARGHLLHAFGPSALTSIFAFCHVGVDFFFVISGFIIVYVHGGDVGHPSALSHYLQRRFTRLMPLYWVIFALWLLIALLQHHVPSASNLLSSALLLPVPTELLVPIAWTLQHEVVFYALFAILILHRDGGLMLFGGWFALIACDLLGLGTDPTAGLMTNVHSGMDIEFFLGMAAARLLRARQMPAPRLLLLAGTAAFFALGAVEDLEWVRGTSPITHLGYGLAAMVIVLGLVESERQGNLRLPRPLLHLGSASYALYLSHILTIGVVWQVLVRLGTAERMSLWAEFMLMVAASVAAGLVISRVVEQPGIRLARRALAAIPATLGTALRPARSVPSTIGTIERAA